MHGPKLSRGRCDALTAGWSSSGSRTCFSRGVAAEARSETSFMLSRYGLPWALPLKVVKGSG